MLINTTRIAVVVVVRMNVTGLLIVPVSANAAVQAEGGVAVVCAHAYITQRMLKRGLLLLYGP